MTTNLHARLRQLNIPALRQRDSGQIYFHAAYALAFICGTPLHTAKSYWHMLKRCDAYFAREGYVGTRLSLPSADGRFRMTDVIDTKTLIYLLRNVKHAGAVSLRAEIGACSDANSEWSDGGPEWSDGSPEWSDGGPEWSDGGPEWVLFSLIGQLKKAARGSSERIADYARLKGKQLKMSLVRVAWSVKFVDGGCEFGVVEQIA